MKKIIELSLCLLLLVFFLSGCKKTEKNYNLGNFEAAITDAKGNIIEEGILGETPEEPKIVIYDNPWGIDDINNYVNSENNTMEFSLVDLYNANNINTILENHKNIQVISNDFTEQIEKTENGYNYKKSEIFYNEENMLQTFEYNIYEGEEYIRLNDDKYQVMDLSIDNDRIKLIESNYTQYIISDKIYFYSVYPYDSQYYILYCNSTSPDYEYVNYIINKYTNTIYRIIYYHNISENNWDNLELDFSYDTDPFAPWFIENPTEKDKYKNKKNITINFQDGSQKTFQIISGFSIMPILEDNQNLYDSINSEQPIDTTKDMNDGSVYWLK